MRVNGYIEHMGILLTIAGIVIALYTFSSVIGLWMSYKVMDSLGDGDGIPEILAEAEPHHIELMGDYAHGWRRHAWAISIIALFTTLLSMLTQSQLAFWALGIAIMIDVGLFLSYPKLKAFLAQTGLQERLLDGAQCAALLAAFTLLFWVHQRAGVIIQ
jgi:hypothetical protein